MALSGSISSTVHTHWKLVLEWSATQNVSDNSSTVTAKLYWQADSYGKTDTDQTKYGSIKIDGTSYSFSASAKLSNGQKKLIATKSKTIKHNSDGTKSFSIEANFDVKLNISGWVDTVKVGPKTFSLNTIPRKSTLTSSKDFTAGTNRTITISRASSSFNHRVYIDVKNSSGDWVNIKAVDFSTSETSKSTSFSSSEFKSIFNNLNQRSSADLRWNLRTYSGSTYIGVNTYTGKLSRPSLSSVSSVNGEAGNSNSVYVDQKISIGISRSNSSFDHKVQFYCGSFMKEFNGVTTSLDWTPSSSEQTSLYNELGSASNKSGYIRVYTYYDGVRVGYTDKAITFYARASVNKPIFSASGVIYADNNPATLNITANDQYIIQGKSTLRVEIPSSGKAVAQNGATMKSYSITVNGDTKNVNYSATSAVSVDFSSINSSADATVTVKAIDSRGFNTTVTKIIKVIPYQPPAVTTTAKRANGFEASTTLTLKGSLSNLNIDGTNKNSLEVARYRYKKVEDANYSAWTTFSTSGFPSYSAPNVILDLDTAETWNIQVEVADMLSVTTKNLTVSVGRPILFLDAEKKSVGIGDFPTNDYELKINGRITFGATMWASTGGGEGFGAIDLNNSDISNANGIYFADVAQNNNGEGLLFFKSGSPYGSNNPADYDNLIVRDGVLYLNAAGSEMKLGNHLQMQNYDIRNVNHITINDPGGNEGIEWLGGSGWKIVEAPNDLSNVGGPLQFATGNTRQATISTAGNIYIAGKIFKGESGGYTYFASQEQACISSDAPGGASLRLHVDGSGGRVWSNEIYNRTYGGASANMYITNEGTLGRISSSAKYKMEIKEIDTETLAARILNLRPKSWYDKAVVEALVNRLGTPISDEESGEEIEEDIPYLERYYGFIAEDLVEEGLEMFATYGKADENGKRELEGIAYDRLWILLVPLVGKQRKQIEELQARLDQLEQTK
ncbi:putative minor structural protein [Bacillus phage BSP36]|nr:putative minor structural protein [Bacillus phage BSP36]